MRVRHVALQLSVFALATLLAVEIVARVALAIPATRDRLVAGTPTGFRLGLTQRVAAWGPDLWLGVTSIPIRFDPVLGWALQEGRYVANDAVVTVSAQALREQRVFAVPKPPGVFRILVLGDSFAFGDEVGDDETFPARLQAALPDVEVINGATIGYAHDQMWLWLRDKGMALQPDVVLLSYVSCDLARDAGWGSVWFKPTYELRDGRLVGPTAIATPDELAGEYYFGSRALDLARIWRERGAPAQDEIDLATALIGQIAEVAREGGARFAMVAAPSYVDEPLPRPYKDYFEPMCDASGATCFDARPAFVAAAARGESTFKLVHWSAAGNQLVADIVASGMKSAPSLGLPSAGASAAHGD